MCAAADPIRLRTATAADVSAIRAIVERAYERYIPRIGRRPGPMDEDHAAQVATGSVVVADAGGEVVGLIVCEPAEDRSHLYVGNVAVEPDRHGQGIGRMLLRHAEDEAARRGLPEVRLHTNAAMTENVERYPRLGFRVVDRRLERGFDRVFFSKPVSGGAAAE